MLSTFEYGDQRLGGDELSSAEINTIVIEAAYGDSSVGWLAMIASHMPFFFSKLPRDSFEAMYADGPDVRARFVAAVMPTHDIELLDTWHVLGMRWSDSRDFAPTKSSSPASGRST